MSKRRNIHEIDGTNDIKYRGPLTYQHFRIIAWLLVALSQIFMLMGLYFRFFPEAGYFDPTVDTIISVLANLALPLFLISNFAVILSSRTNYKKLFLKFGVLSLGVILFYLFVYERYILGFFSANSTREAAKQTVAEIMADSGFTAFNLFIDLLLCTLVMFFLNYIPKRVFTGKRLAVFRSLAILPIVYEAASIILKLLASTKKISLSPVFFPFLTTKPPLEFIVFIALALFIKRRERKFKKNGKTIEEYDEFLKTNSNSWHFSVFASIIMVIAAAADFLITILIVIISSYEYAGTEMLNAVIDKSFDSVIKLGFGMSIPLILVAPIMLLFSYNRKPRRPNLDSVIPIGGTALIIMIYIEAIYEFVITMLAENL